MNEGDWVDLIASRLRKSRPFSSGRLDVQTKLKLAYEQLVSGYGSGGVIEAKPSKFETDLAIVERGRGGIWIPRVVIEAKIKSVTTHDALTYSAKAGSHRNVHPYLRYGVMLGKRKHFPLPGRLYHHGAQFDFLFSFKNFRPSESEMTAF